MRYVEFIERLLLLGSGGQCQHVCGIGAVEFAVQKSSSGWCSFKPSMPQPRVSLIWVQRRFQLASGFSGKLIDRGWLEIILVRVGENGKASLRLVHRD